MKRYYTLFCLLIFQVTILYSQSWNLTGNAGTITGTNFLGTTDAKAFMIKVNNQKSGYIDYANTNAANTSLGYQTLLNISGSKGGNSAFGYQSLHTNSSGGFNTVSGQLSMYFNKTGSSNVAAGVRSLYSNTTGSFNTAFGNRALYFNTVANNNTGIGNRALYNNTVGYSNVAIGVDALNKNTVNSNLVAIGDSSLYNDQYDDFSGEGGINNTAVGSKTLFSNTEGGYNIAIGDQALYSNDLGSQNVAIGSKALYKQSSVPDFDDDWVTANIAIGTQALYNTDPEEGSEVGVYNTAVGFEALYYNTTGYYNTAFGYNAGYNVKDGGENTYLGALANSGTTGHITNSTAVGYGATITSNNHVRIGNTSVTSIGGQVAWTNFSDERIKTNIKEDVPGLAFINLLKPVTYNFNIDKQQEVTGRKDSSNSKSKYDINKILFTGFLAQQVEAAAKKINYDFSGVDKPANDKDVYGLRYSDFVVPLVKAVQELSAQNDSLKNIYNEKFNEQQKQIDELKTMIVSNQSTANSQLSTLSSASLQQNIPNPFSNTTTISYSIPQQFSSAKIIITDKNGNALKQINISNNKGNVIVDAATLISGGYQYSLIVDGKMLASKQMILNK